MDLVILRESGESITVNDRLHKLFREWQAARNYSRFFKDGVVGEKDWSRKHPKILFLLKENYSADWKIDGAIDIRGGTNTQFFSNLARWKYLVENAYKKNKVGDYPTDEVLVDFLGGWKLADVAYVNVKKSIGESQSDNKEIQNFAVQDKEFLSREIDIINPDVVICGGTFWSYHPVYNGNDNIEAIADRVHKHNNRVVVDFHHPGWKQCPGGQVGLYDKLKTILNSNDVMDAIRS